LVPFFFNPGFRQKRFFLLHVSVELSTLLCCFPNFYNPPPGKSFGSTPPITILLMIFLLSSFSLFRPPVQLRRVPLLGWNFPVYSSELFPSVLLRFSDHRALAWNCRSSFIGLFLRSFSYSGTFFSPGLPHFVSPLSARFEGVSFF